MSIQRASSDVSSWFSSKWKYDVFLSFRGEDTRKNFTYHLYAALDGKGFNVFKDDKELGKGKPISPELLQAIEDSRFSVVVLSSNYASSSWCLDELVKIVECKNTKGQTLIPVFYNVDPSVVGKQTGNFQVAFAKHEETFGENSEKVQKWMNALTEVANLSGWDSKDRHESEFIQDIVNDISQKVGPTKLMPVEGLVGIGLRLKKLMLCIGLRPNDVRMIGICGMRGIGKTTIARVVYGLISYEFEGSSFLANVREVSEKDGLISLQNQLLSQILVTEYNNIWNVHDGMNEIRCKLRQKKVLIVIDDVVHAEQLNELAGSLDWFGLGSRIIITSRDEHLLKNKVDEVFMVDELNDDEALQLFSLKAFKTYQPFGAYVELSKCVVRYASGLPLALEVLGSFLFHRSIEEWRSALERLRRDSEKDILDILQDMF